MQSSGTAAAAAVVRCDACGHAVPWRPQFAGRKVKCRCGHVQLVPAQPPAGAQSSAGSPAAASAASAAASTAANATAPAARPAPPVAASRPAPPPTKRPAPAPQRPSAQLSPRPPQAAAPPAAPAPAPLPGEASFDDVFAQAAQEASAASQAPAAGGDDDLYDLAPGDAAPARRYQAAAPAASAGAYAAPGGVGHAAAAPAGVPSAVLAYRQVNRRQVEVEKEASAFTNKQLILPACLIAAGLLLTLVEARMFIGEWNAPAMLVYSAVSTVINLVLIFAALLFTARILDLGLGEIAPALLKITAVAILPAAVSGIIEHGLQKHLSFMSGYVAWFSAVLMYWYFLWLLFDMDFQEVAICTAIIWVIRTWVGMAIFLALFKALFGTGMPGYDDEGPDPGSTPPGMVIPDDPDLEDDGDEGMVLPQRPPATQPTTGPGTAAEEEMEEEDE